MMRIAMIAVFVTAQPELVQPRQIPNMWPFGVEFPAGAVEYKRTNLTQYCAISNGRDDHQWFKLDQDQPFQNAPPILNPNRFNPYAIPGGLHDLDSWKSTLFVMLPSGPKSWVERVPIAMSERNLPKWRWQYPIGTQFFDLLSKDGKPFELRRRMKEEDGSWLSSVPWADESAAPTGYAKAGNCNTCHNKAGGSEAYGITVRGDDTVFSYLPELKR